MLAVSYLVRGLALAAVLMPLAVACGGTVEHVSDEEDGSGGRSSGGALATGGSGAHATGGRASGGSSGSGGSQNTGGTYVDPGCEDMEPPPPDYQCDPLDPSACGVGWGCYAYVEHPPKGTGCGFQKFGSRCYSAGTGLAGDFCGDEHGNCAPSYLCVVGAGAGKTCQKLCSTTGVSGCAPGLFCGETDIEGYGVCF